jgi:ubiquinone/menaquinone biosynthesis C-methylase UbiE
MAAAERKDVGMEGWLARWYARTRQTDMEDFRRQAATVAARCGGRGKVLEVAPGPGYFAVELAKLGDFRITGLDISHTFVRIASGNAAKAGVLVDFRQGNVSAMPFADALFDFVYCSAAFKNFAEPVKALDEMHRVLRDGGEVVIVDLRKDVPMEEIDAYVRRSGRTVFDAWITKQTFRRLLIRRAHTQEVLEQMAAKSRFGACRIKVESIGLEVRLTKADDRSSCVSPFGGV